MEKAVDWVLIGKYIAGECSVEGRRIVEEDPEMKEIAESIASYLAEQISYPVDRKISAINEVESLKRLHRAISFREAALAGKGEISSDQSGISSKAPSISNSERENERGSVFNLSIIFRIAAVVLILVGSVYVTFNARTFFGGKRTAVPSSFDFSTGRGEQKRLLLADGTRITLNSVSSIRVAKDYGKRSRIVELKGEAFFDVVHLKTPFIVRTDCGIIQDIGTEFVVRAWPGEKETEVTVTKGEIILRAGDLSNSIGVPVVAGQRSVSDRNRILLEPVRADLKQTLAWLDGDMIFDKTPFSHVLAKLGRDYPYTFGVTDTSLLGERVTASLTRQPLAAILKAISVSLGIGYVRNGDTIRFERDATIPVHEQSNVQRN